MLDRLRKEPDAIEEFLYPDDGDGEPPNYVDVDKAWHGIHYLLTGQAEGGPRPLSLAVLGGGDFGTEDGYGPAHVVRMGPIHPSNGCLPAAFMSNG